MMSEKVAESKHRLVSGNRCKSCQEPWPCQVKTLSMENKQLRDLLIDAHVDFCSNNCPSVKRDGDLWTHTEACQRMQAAIKGFIL